MLSHTPSPVTTSPPSPHLRWLPIPQRIHFKLLIITRKALHKLLCSARLTLPPRSADTNLLSPSSRITTGPRGGTGHSAVHSDSPPPHSPPSRNPLNQRCLRTTSKLCSHPPSLPPYNVTLLRQEATAVHLSTNPLMKNEIIVMTLRY